MFSEESYSANEDDGVLTACIERDSEIDSNFNVTIIVDESDPADAESERVEGFKQQHVDPYVCAAGE